MERQWDSKSTAKRSLTVLLPSSSLYSSVSLTESTKAKSGTSPSPFARLLLLGWRYYRNWAWVRPDSQTKPHYGPWIMAHASALLPFYSNRGYVSSPFVFHFIYFCSFIYLFYGSQNHKINLILHKMMIKHLMQVHLMYGFIHKKQRKEKKKKRKRNNSCVACFSKRFYNTCGLGSQFVGEECKYILFFGDVK